MPRDLGKVIAHIPARAGSKRVRAKNLRILLDRPMIAYAIQAALDCPALDEVYVNTDSPELMEVGRALGAKVYERAPELCSDTASGDDFTDDIIRKLEPDTLVMISPVCPLVEAKHVTEALEAYAKSDADTLITASQTQMQTFCEGKPINIELDAPLAPSQDNPPVLTCNWAATVWDAKTFLKNYEAYKGGYLGTKRLLHPIDPLSAVKVSYEDDFRLAEALLRFRDGATSADQTEARYWEPGQPVIQS